MPPLRIGVNALYLIPGGVGGTEIYLRGLLDGLHDPGIAGERRNEGADRSLAGEGKPHDEPGEKPAHDENREEQSPHEKPAPCPGAHAGKDLGVDDRIVDAGDCLEDGKPEDRERNAEEGHGASYPLAGLDSTVGAGYCC